MSDVIHLNGISAGACTDFDGVAFLYGGIKKKEESAYDVWSIHYLTAPEGTEEQFKSGALGFKYTIVLKKIGGESGVEIFDAILGDPVAYINNCMKAREGGFIVKTSEWSKQVVDKFLELIGE